ncbi:MAG: trehalase family glycosidase, partial [Fimbriimonadales bacterium]
YLVGGIGTLPSFGGIDARLDSARSKYENLRPSATGDWGDFLGAIADNLNNSRLYSSDNRMLAHSVSRGWASTPNTAPYFCWDSFFNGNLACIDDPVTARNTVRAILSCQTADGLVPNFGHWNFDGGRVSTDRSQPPVGSMCVWKMHQRWPDKAFLEEVYPKLLAWHRWWPKARDGNHNGLLEWGSATGQLQGAKWETGWDDTVHFEGAAMVGPNMNADAVDLNSMWAMDAEYLGFIATAIGKKDEARAFAAEHKAICGRINKVLWNPELGIYCSKLWSGQFLTRITPMNFYPLIAGVPSAEQAKSVLAIMTDPKRFWGQWILPTVAYDDPVWPKQDYWRGKVWAPVNYLVYQGLLRYASPEVLNQFADRSRELFMRNWTAKGVCGENYLSSTGEQSSDPHYTWGALLCLISLENVVHLEPDGKVWLNGTLQATAILHNVPINGRRYHVFVSPGKTELVSDRNGRAVITAAGSIVRAKLP